MPCQPLPNPADDSLPALLDNHDQVTMRYHDCSARNAALLRSLDEWRSTARSWYCAALAASGLHAADCNGAAKLSAGASLSRRDRRVKP